MKKYMALILALLMVCSLMACGTEGKEDELDPDMFFPGEETASGNKEKTTTGTESIDIDPADYDYSGMCGEEAYWVYREDSKELIIYGSGPMYDYEGPSDNECAPWSDFGVKSAKIYGVSTIGEDSFYRNETLTSVEIADSVESIESFAFSQCESLTSVEIPADVTNIEEHALSGCYTMEKITVKSGNSTFMAEDGVLFTKDGKTLVQYPAGKTDTNYTVPNGVITIGWGAFSGTQYLQQLDLGSDVEVIETNAFTDRLAETTIPTMSLPVSLKLIEDDAFGRGIEKIYYAGTQEQWEQIENEEFPEASYDKHYMYGAAIYYEQ